MADPRTEPDVFEADAPTSIRPRLVPTVLVVGASRSFYARCKETLEMSGVGLDECSIDSYKPVATRLWPPVIVMTEELYAFDPDGFLEIALALGSRLVRVPGEGVGVDQLSALLVPAVFEAMKSYAR